MAGIEQPEFPFPGGEGGIEVAKEPNERPEVVDHDEIIHCQYCQDGGPCVYCSRGREAIASLRRGK